MSTIINNPGGTRVEPERTVLVNSADSSAGWAVAVVILLVVIVGGAYWYTHHYRAPAPASGGTNINVTLPATGGTTQTTTQ